MRVRRIREDGIGVTIHGDVEHVITDAQALDLASALAIEAKNPPARRTIEHHSDTGRLGQAQDDFARRPRTVLLDGRGDAAPRNPEDQGDGA